MESRYGIGINNRYALFLEGEDGEDLIVPKKKTSDTKAPVIDAKPAAPAVKKADNMDSKKDKTNNQNNRVTKDNKANNREDKENRNNRFEGKRVLDARKPQDGPRENREDRNNRRNKPDGAGDSGAEKRGERGERGGRGGGRGRGDRGGRGGPGGRGGIRGKRDFDRKSGDDKTGVKPVDKKEGSGSHNWGTYEDEMKAEEDKANISTENAEVPADAENAETQAANEAEEARKAAEEEEAKTMTLAEWKAQQAKKDQPKFNLRKAGEGSDLDPKWKKTYAYKKEKETQDEDEDEEHEIYLQRANRQKKVLDIEFSFNETAAGPGAPDRGGRGGGRGRGGRDRRGGGRGGERGDRGDRGDRGERRGGGGFGKARGKGTEAPNVNDEMSFPSLG